MQMFEILVIGSEIAPERMQGHVLACCEQDQL